MTWAYEGVECYVSAGHRANHTALYHAWNGRDNFYTTDKTEYDLLDDSYKKLPVACWVARNKAPDHVPLYRLYSEAVDDHFYCVSAKERDEWVRKHHYKVEGIAGYVTKTERAGHVPLLRAWNPKIKDHFYTIDCKEIDDRGPSLKKGQLTRLLNRDLGPHLFKWKRYYLTEDRYFCPTLRAAREIIRRSGVPKRRYIDKIHECDAFAHLLKAAFIEDAYDGGFPSVPYAFGVIWGRNPVHAFNVLVVNDGRKASARLVDPQKGTVSPPLPGRREDIYMLCV